MNGTPDLAAPNAEIPLPERLRLGLAADPPQGLLPGDLVEGGDGEKRQAAVLVAITERSRPGLILTVRHEGLRTHAGQRAQRLDQPREQRRVDH